MTGPPKIEHCPPTAAGGSAKITSSQPFNKQGRTYQPVPAEARRDSAQHRIQDQEVTIGGVELTTDTGQKDTGNSTDADAMLTALDGDGVPFVGAVVDRRRREFRHYQRAFKDYCADSGGPEHMSRAQLDLARRCAGVNTLCDKFEAAIVAGEEVDVAEYLGACNVARRLAVTLGLKRRAMDVTPDLRSYLAAKAQTND